MSLIDKLKENKRKNDEAGLNDPTIFKKKLRNGEFGLKRTFWLYWFLPVVGTKILDFVLVNTMDDTKRVAHYEMIMVALVYYISWYTFLGVKNTTGRKLWRSAAMIIIALHAIMITLAVILIFL
ncbi:hypothetical protein B6O77_000875 [Salmonella enterica subsp. enterica serovar Mississippi]|nr:hypothetical protein [Salmonella enterica subsp. enterica serovar Mississippi]